MVTIYSWNVNGIRALAKRGFAEWLRATGDSVVGLQEVKIGRDLPPALDLPPGCHAHWHGAERPGYSGVAAFSRLAHRAVSTGLSDKRFDHEGRVLRVEYEPFTFYNIYFPSGSQGPERIAHKLAFYERFLEVVGAEIAAGERIVVAGDVNTAYAEIDLARPRQNRTTSGFMPHERAALGRFFEAGLVDTFRHARPDEQKFSWWSQVTNSRERNIGWRLDYIFVSRNLLPFVVDADIHTDVLGSDHCPVSVTLALP